MGRLLNSQLLLALVLALLGACTFDKSQHPDACQADGDCAKGERCYRSFCVQEGASGPGAASSTDASQDGARPDGAVQGSGGKAGSAGIGVSTAGSGAIGTCQPNPDTTDQVCTEICPESCNNKDDDCDRKVDEDVPAAMCSLSHASSMCARGVCLVVECTDGYRDCDRLPENGCEAAPTDIDNCGSCGHACSYANGVAACVGGQCVRKSCTTGFGDCDSDPSDCETRLASLDNCGGCGLVCENVPNASASCATGACGPGMCGDGFGDCNLLASDGCEQALDTLTDCAACATPCALAGSVSDCGGGVCLATACASGFDECDGDPRDGCESLSSASSCGTCGNRCDATGPNAMAASCSSGTCTLVCTGAFDDCDHDPSNGCETPVDVLSNCGVCGAACSIDHATATCATGTCKVSECAQGYDDCDHDGLSCETPLDTLTDCGSCATPCAKASCKGGVCSSATCTAPMADCDGLGGTCEVNLATDSNNCGACDNKCELNSGGTPHATLTGCSAMACQISCDAGYESCNGLYKDGCETSTTTLTDCGACATPCSVTNGSASCSTGTCKPTGCDIDYGDCDVDPTDCETALTSPSNCGACNAVCNLPNAVAACGGSPGQRVCTIAACASSSFQDCDGLAGNGCERDVSTYGPCLPEPDCTKATYGGHSYYVCTTNQQWKDARAQCRTQLLGDLLRIDDASEAAFVHSIAGSASYWIGGTDTGHVGVWVWSLGGVPFWLGGSGGHSLFGRFTDWSSGQPTGGGHCGGLHGVQATAAWYETTCTSTLPFICEEGPDQCPSDPNKIDPGQCGCGSPDTDVDSDGFAVCNDACDGDPAKIAPGVCGCGVPDVDSDGDGTLDCHDGCPMDRNKTAPGQCGCGSPDTDTDGDGAADCVDGCPMDKTKTAPGQCGCGTDDTDTDGDGVADCVDGCPMDKTHADGCFNYKVGNYDPGTDYVEAPSLVIDSKCGVVTLDTSTAGTNVTVCGQDVKIENVSQSSGGPDVALVRLHSLSVAQGSGVRAIGKLPLIVIVGGDAMIDGFIDASSIGATSSGAGASASCSSGIGGAGTGSMVAGGGGGGGGGFGATGARGGSGGLSGGTGAAGGSQGTVEGNVELMPLRGGCDGGRGGASGNVIKLGRLGGSGGGAIQISVGGTLSVSGVATVSGGGGRQGTAGGDAGGGGGSGGALLLEGAHVNITAGARVTANGGGAASGRGSGNANDGQDGSPDTANAAAGGLGSVGGGNGGAGGARASSSLPGQPGSIVLGGGGGGGGGVGRIRVNGALSCSIAALAVKSPALSTSCPP
jgi:hypothetical protein